MVSHGMTRRSARLTMGPRGIPQDHIGMSRASRVVVRLGMEVAGDLYVKVEGSLRLLGAHPAGERS